MRIAGRVRVIGRWCRTLGKAKGLLKMEDVLMTRGENMNVIKRVTKGFDCIGRRASGGRVTSCCRGGNMGRTGGEDGALNRALWETEGIEDTSTAIEVVNCLDNKLRELIAGNISCSCNLRISITVDTS